MTEGNRRKTSLSDTSVARKAMVFLEDSIVRKTGKALNTGTSWWLFHRFEGSGLSKLQEGGN